jgi:cobalt/nickel transport system permease protein
MLIDQAAYSNRLRRAHPAEKAAFCAVCLLASLLAREPVLPCLAAGLCTAVALGVARIPVRTWSRLCFLPVGFLLTGGLSLAVEFAQWRPFVTEASLHRAIAVTARSMGCSTALLLLAATTPFTDLLQLLRRLRVPALALDLLTITYRSLFILLETAEQMRRAQTSRLGYGTFRSSLRSLGTLAARLFGRSLERADLSWKALLSRGYDEEWRVLAPEYETSGVRLAAGSALALALLGTAVIR